MVPDHGSDVVKRSPKHFLQFSSQFCCFYCASQVLFNGYYSVLKMRCSSQIPFMLLVVLPSVVTGMIIKTESSLDDDDQNDTSTRETTTASSYVTNDVTSDVAQESANFFTDIGPPNFSARTFDSPEYDSLFDSFPNLPYFPDFGEIFRIQKTTPKPPFRFPDYVRDAFPDRPPESLLKPLTDTSVTGGRRPSRRPPRPAPSGTKAKLAKQNQSEQKEKKKPAKSKAPGKGRDYPKIFRFTADRVNLAEFDMRKKVNGNYLSLVKGDDLDSDKIQRNKFLILHGGVFEIEGGTPNSNNNNNIFGASSNLASSTAITDYDLASLKDDSEKGTEEQSSLYLYKRRL